MRSAVQFWCENAELKHLTPPGGGAEGFDVHEVLRGLIPSGTVLSFGCGDGRLAPAFSPERYHGVDINPHAIAQCWRTSGYGFSLCGDGDLPQADTVLCYTVLLHIDDETIAQTVQRITKAAPRTIVAEILGRRWRKPGEPQVFNRELEEYDRLFAVCGRKRVSMKHWPYLRYNGTFISFMEYGPLRNTP
jgi:SAM-dependent methyltransferase